MSYIVIDGGGTNPPPPPPPGGSSHLSRQGNQLRLYGQLYQYGGLNGFGIAGCDGVQGSPYSQAAVDALMAALPPRCMVRMWGFSAGYVTGIQRAINAALAYDQRLIISLAEGAGYCGYPRPTHAWFVDGYTGSFFTHIENIVGQFKDSPAIGMWEIMNEPHEPNSDWPTLRNFFDGVAAKIKSIDPLHLVETGVLSETSVGGEANYEMIHAGPQVDVLSVHEYDYDYPSASSPSRTIISGHVTKCLARANALGKPLIVGESGITANDHDCATNRATRAAAWGQKVSGYLGMGVAGCNYWTWKPAFTDACDRQIYTGDPIFAYMRGQA